MRELAEFAVPSYVIGAGAALGAGGLAAFAGQPSGWAVLTGLALGIPIALLGAGYSTLVALQKAPVGVFAPAAAWWFLAFPAAMLVHSIATEWLFTGGPGLPAGPLWQFLLYNAILSMGFAIGFIWLYERITPAWLIQIKDHNSYAERVYTRYVAHAEAVWTARARKRAQRAARR